MQKFNINCNSVLDRVKLYNHPYMNPDGSPESLQRKVQFDIRLYFFRRGCENMEEMRRDHFKAIFRQDIEEWVVVKNRDELTKNHKTAEAIVTGFMPENRDDPLCPVRSFIMYTEHLNPENDYLWQVPLRKMDPNNPDVWFGKGHIGKNPLAKFMKNISINCQLSKIYSNHSIRVTGATILTRNKFSASEIMSVTGHNSVQSLTIYQKTEERQKVAMGKVITAAMKQKGNAITFPQHQPQSEAPRQRQILPAPMPNASLQQNINPAIQYPANASAAVQYPIQPLPPPPPLQPNSAAVQYPFQPLPPPPPPQLNPIPVVANKENVEDAVVPFCPNFDSSQPQGSPSFDILSLINDIEEDERRKQNTQVTNMSSTNNVLNNVPRSMFANCSIGNITFNVKK